MYVTADQACNIQGGASPIPAATIAQAQALTNSLDALAVAAQNNWMSVISRNWQSFANLGPQVAYQLRDPSANPGPAVVAAGPLGGSVAGSGSGNGGAQTFGGNGGSPYPSTNGGAVGGGGYAVGGGGYAVGGGSISPGPPVGIDLVPTGNPDGSNPAAGQRGGVVGSGWGRRGAGGAVSDFVRRFGVSPFQTYTGPLPAPGSVASLQYGGASSPNPVGPGVFAATPQAAAGFYYPAADCPNPVGVAMLPFGEPAYPGGVSADSSGATSGGASSYLWLWGLLGLAGLAYLSDKSDKKQGRTRA